MEKPVAKQRSMICSNRKTEIRGPEREAVDVSAGRMRPAMEAVSRKVAQAKSGTTAPGGTI